MSDSSQQACDDYRLAERRHFMRTAGRICALGALSGPAWMPKMSFADSHDSSSDLIIQIFLRGGADGMTMCVPFGDADYYTVRQSLAIADPSSMSADKATDLDGFFGLPPALVGLKPMWDAGEFAIVHNTGFPFIDRSHFNAMNLIERGTGSPGISTGWLGRHLLSRNLPAGDRILALAPQGNLPTTLFGAPQAVVMEDIDAFGLEGNWDFPATRMPFLESVYSNSVDVLKESAEATVGTLDLIGSLQAGYGGPANGAMYPDHDFGRGMETIARVAKADVGLEAACIDLGNWDHHGNQGPISGDMASKMKTLADGLVAFRDDMGSRFDNTTVVVISEFGRRVEQNGSGGTDHGTAGTMFVLGGAVNGGQVFADWVGLDPSVLEDGIDLPITIDSRDVLGEILQKRAGNSDLSTVFPGHTMDFQNIVTVG